MYYYLQTLVNPELHSDKLFKLLLSQPFNLAPKDFEIIYNKHSQYKSIIDTIKSINLETFSQPEKFQTLLIQLIILQISRLTKPKKYNP